jgi:outer membrane protein assembly factor BamB
VYFLTAGHEVIAVDIEAGRIRWRSRIDDEGHAPIGGTVVATDGLIVVGDYDVIAVKAATGTLAWRFSPVSGYGAGIYLGEDAADGLLFSGSPSGALFAIEVASGTQRWTRAIGGDVATTVFAPAVTQGVVLAGFTSFGNPSSGGVLAADARSGRLIWKAEFPESRPAISNLAFSGGPVVYRDVVLAARPDGAICGFRLADGSVAFVIEAPQPRGLNYRALAVTGSTLIAGSLTGEISAYAIDTQRLIWRMPAPERGSAGFRITLDGETVYIPYLSGELVALDWCTGRELWSTMTAHGRFPWAPVTRAGRVFLAGTDALVALGS